MSRNNFFCQRDQPGAVGRGRAREDGSFKRALSMYRPRNAQVVDVWSFVHLGVCALLALVFGPLLAFVIALAWEPIEILVLSPLLARAGIDFGHETLKNSLSDIGFNFVGVIAGGLVLALTPLQAPFALG